MTNDIHPAKTNGHGDYERQDIGVRAVYYFLGGLAVALVLAYFVVNGFYHSLEKRAQADQTPVSPLVANAPVDTRRLPSEYKTDSEGADYEKYLQKNFPEPQLETNERTELNKIRQREEETLSTYDYVDQNAGTIRIPIDRAMDLLAQRGLPTRTQPSDLIAVSSTQGKAKEANKK
ncbi:MAG: hypothetical protein LAP86_05370 [Acidobacteriia bacterium]|nr:hypothetical protein [Terriglobia bacterium]